MEKSYLALALVAHLLDRVAKRVESRDSIRTNFYFAGMVDTPSQINTSPKRQNKTAAPTLMAR